MTEPPVEDAGLWTVANVVSMARLAAIPVFLWLLLGRDDIAGAAWLMLVIGATDWLDGSLARALNQVSEIGKFLDPLADRIAIVAALVGGLIAGVVPGIIGWLLLIREIVVAVGALFVVRRLGRNVEVKYLGKVATFIVYGAIPSFYFAAAGTEVFEPIGWVSGIIGLVLYYAVTVDYGRDVIAAMSDARAA
jgi:cardiolipin synthase